MSESAVQQAINNFIEHLGKDSPRAKKIIDALKNGMYPPKYIYLLILENQL